MKAPSQAVMLRQAANSMRHALCPVTWAAETLKWHADPWQADFMRSSAPQTVVITSRQSGKSSSTAVLAAHVAIFQPGALVLLIAQRQLAASELLKKCRNVLLTRSLGIKLAQDAQTSLELRNGSRIVCLPSSSEAVRGYSAPAMIVEDEAAYIDDEVHDALRPMMATTRNGRFILLSTPAGKSGHFYDAAHSPNWERFKVTAHDVPRISPEWLEKERFEKGELFYRREFMVEFSDSEFSFFGSDLIAAAFDCEAEPLRLSVFT